ncbi:MAG: hypothetical protein WD696_03685 [Bryobacteraceae bacterium]
MAAAGANALAGAPVDALMDQLGEAESQPVLKLDGLKTPLIVDSLRLLKKGGDHFVRA